jgi:hypothetical protein
MATQHAQANSAPAKHPHTKPPSAPHKRTIPHNSQDANLPTLTSTHTHTHTHTYSHTLTHTHTHSHTLTHTHTHSHTLTHTENVILLHTASKHTHTHTMHTVPTQYVCTPYPTCWEWPAELAGSSCLCPPPALEHPTPTTTTPPPPRHNLGLRGRVVGRVHAQSVVPQLRLQRVRHSRGAAKVHCAQQHRTPQH